MNDKYKPEAAALADAVLKAAGSGLKHYTMEKIRDGIVSAAQKGIDESRAELLQAAELMLLAYPVARGGTGQVEARDQLRAAVDKAGA